MDEEDLGKHKDPPDEILVAEVADGGRHAQEILMVEAVDGDGDAQENLVAEAVAEDADVDSIL